MTEDEATAAARAIEQMFPHVTAFPADPRRNLTLIWDRRSVEMFRDLLLAQTTPDASAAPREELRRIADMFGEWLERADPVEDPSVPLVEAIFDTVASPNATSTSVAADRPTARVSMCICACVTRDEAPTWLVYEDADGGLHWARIPDGTEADEFVDAQISLGGHADPSQVLDWLRGDASAPWSPESGWGDEGELDRLLAKFR